MLMVISLLTPFAAWVKVSSMMYWNTNRGQAVDNTPLQQETKIANELEIHINVCFSAFFSLWSKM
jgi:hypothetical protein